MKELMHVGFGLPKTRGEKDPRSSRGVLFKLPRGHKVLDQYLKLGIRVIFMLRDPKSVLISRHLGGKMVVEPKRWIDAIKMYERCQRNEGLLLVKFEELVQYPNKVQKEISKKFELKIVKSFAEAWQDFDQKDSSDVFDMRGIRPMDPSRVDSWKYVDAAQKKKLKRIVDNPELLKYMDKYGYKPLPKGVRITP